MLQIGWAMRSMTPDRPVMVQGQMHVRIAREALDPLYVTALAIDDTSADCAIIVACDIAFISEPMQQAVRDRLAIRLPSVPADKIFLNATHTHTSLVFMDGFYIYPGGEVMSPQECNAFVIECAADAAAAAWDDRTPHSIGAAFSHAVVGHNRRAIYADGLAQMYGSTNRDDFRWIEGYEDHSLDLLFTWDARGRLSGIAIDVPCPSQTDEHLETLSADFWHDIRVELGARLGDGVRILPLCGAAGDQSPHFMLYGAQEAEMRRRRGVSERREIALRVADAVERALACTTPPPTADITFAHSVRRLTLTPRGVSRVERDWAQAEYERVVSSGDTDSWWPQRLHGVVEQHDGLRTAEPVPVELHVLRIGDVALVTNPFELFIDYGLRIKARSPAAQTLVVQLAAGLGWYLPTERAVNGGGYGAMPAVSIVGPEGGAEYVEATLAMIRELFPVQVGAGV